MLRRLVASAMSPSAGTVQPPFGSTSGAASLLRLVGNRLAYLSLSQPALLEEEFPSASNGPPVFPHDHCVPWEVSMLRGGIAVEHPIQSGLWFIRRALTAKQCADALQSIDRLTGGGGVQGHDGICVRPRTDANAGVNGVESRVLPERTWHWYEYEKARWMVPLQPSCGVDPLFAATLCTLRSHGCTDPLTWPLLSGIDDRGGAALRHIEDLPPSLLGPPTFSGRLPLFMQLQALERGAPITAHVDEHDVGGRAIATVVLQGSSEVRVGGVTFAVGAGDMYMLEGLARDEVDHEVFSSLEDRVSVTTRYGVRTA